MLNVATVLRILRIDSFQTVIDRCSRLAVRGTAVFFAAEVIGAVIFAQLPADKYPKLAELSVVFAWWIVGSLVILPMVYLFLWLMCAIRCLIVMGIGRLKRSNLGSATKPIE